VETPTTPSTPPRAIDALESPTDPTLERGFVASLRWLVAEGDVRGVRRIAVELRALREALATLDETRSARDDYARRATELDRELQAAMAVLGPGTAVNGNGSLLQRLARLRERLAEDTATRRQITLERDAWRAMCELLTQTRARVHELLDETEIERDSLASALEVMRARVVELTTLHDDAAQDAAQTRAELSALRERLRDWSGTVERALQELMRGSRALTDGDSGG
jgi:chromosome segregation ATPase